MHLLTGILSALSLLSLSSSVPHPHPSDEGPFQIDLDRLISLTPLIDPSTIPSNVTPEELAEQAKGNSQSESLPNPIAQDYPDQITGTINASYFVIPISYEEARAVVPVKYNILTHQIKKVWKEYGKHKYPVRSSPLVQCERTIDNECNSSSSPFNSTTTSKSASQSPISTPSPSASPSSISSATGRHPTPTSPPTSSPIPPSASQPENSTASTPSSPPSPLQKIPTLMSPARVPRVREP